MAVKKKAKVKSRTAKKAAAKVAKKTAARKAPAKKAADTKAKAPAPETAEAAPAAPAAKPAAGPAKADSAGKLRVTLTKSVHGRLAAHQACATGLGLRRRHQTVEVEDTPCTRGMINKIRYMLDVEGR